LINPSSLAVVGAVAAVAVMAIVVAINWTLFGEMTRLTTAAASVIVGAPFVFFSGQGRWVANVVVVVAKAIAVVVARSVVIAVIVVVVTTHCFFLAD
jgi:hypothetical protein